MKDVLVTGAAGFIGSNLVSALLKTKEYHVVGVDNLNNYYKKRNVEMNKSDEFEFLVADVTDKNAMESIFATHHFSYVVHLAARACIANSMNYPKEVFENNTKGFDTVSTLACKNDVKHVIYASSSSVYGDNGVLRSVYAVSKSINETQADKYAFLCPTTKFSGLRFFTVYGWNMRPDLGIWKFKEAISNNEKITVYGDGTQSRDYVYIDDITNAIIKVMECDKEWHSEVFDVGYGESVEVNRVIDILKSYINPNFNNVEYVEERKCDVKKTLSSPTKLYEIVGYKPQISIETGLSMMLNKEHS
jgi:UDP-glucuronate 4-epimerase